MTTRYLACDLGAESGRLMLGTLADDRLELTELHRFANVPVRSGESLHWDIPRLFAELQTGLAKAAATGQPIASISADSWGVDYLMFDGRDQLIPPAFHYRDPRSTRGVQRANARVSWPEIFAETGIQFMPINTLYQLMAETGERLGQTRRLLGVGDGFNHLLGGEACVDQSMASTWQLYNPRAGDWSWKLIDALGLPRPIFPPVVPCGSLVGKLKPELATASGLPALDIIATCSHDTGAAVAAVPAEEGSWAYLSSGTWSLMGVELPEPVITETSQELNFTNELGYGGTVRLLKNIVGLWIVQECRRDWEEQGRDHFDYAALTELAAAAPPFVSLINPADPRFLAPGDMPLKIAAYCHETGQPAPASPGAFIRCVLESLALLYRQTLGQLEQLTGRKTDRLHIVGGGGKNALLNQFAANACQIPVITGPVEATAVGNVLIQAITLGHLGSLTEARDVVRRSFDTATVIPAGGEEWLSAYARFQKLPG
jgi:rhamnulokinase